MDQNLNKLKPLTHSELKAVQTFYKWSKVEDFENFFSNDCICETSALLRNGCQCGGN